MRRGRRRGRTISREQAVALYCQGLSAAEVAKALSPPGETPFTEMAIHYHLRLARKDGVLALRPKGPRPGKACGGRPLLPLMTTEQWRLYRKLRPMVGREAALKEALKTTGKMTGGNDADPED